MADSAPGGSEPSCSWTSVAASRFAACGVVTGMTVRSNAGRVSTDGARSSGRDCDQR